MDNYKSDSKVMLYCLEVFCAFPDVVAPMLVYWTIFGTLKWPDFSQNHAM